MYYEFNVMKLINWFNIASNMNSSQVKITNKANFFSGI